MRPPPPNVRPLGDFQSSDFWQTHVNAIFYGIQGPGIHDHFQTFVSRDHRLAHALAERFYQSVTQSSISGPLRIMEWGVGNGNLAGSFLSFLKAHDTEGRVYPRLRYSLCDFSEEILKGARRQPRLEDHLEQVDFVHMNAEAGDVASESPVHQIISNEIWDDLATKVLVKLDGQFLEEFLQPHLDPTHITLPFDEFADAFREKDLDRLKTLPAFLDHIHWERTLRKSNLADLPHADEIKNHFENIEERIPVPVNTGAFQTLKRASDLLAESSFGYTGFDYGMLGFEELNRVGRPYFKLYGGQYTNMVNFPLLKSIGESLRFTNITLKPQHLFVSDSLGEPVLSALDLVQAHPNIRRLDPWDVDLLMIQTLAALNQTYKSPYRLKLEYPPVQGTPKKQRKRLAEMVKQLSGTGVPDTVAYITLGEAQRALPALKKIGYHQQDIDTSFNTPPPPVAFSYINFSK